MPPAWEPSPAEAEQFRARLDAALRSGTVTVMPSSTMSSSTVRAVHGACCPACGKQKLHLLQTGVIFCLAPGCPEPDAAQKVLSDPETRDIVEFTGDDFRILHPLRERIGGSLFDCPVNRACQEMGEPPRDSAGRLAPGRYRAWMDKDGILTLDMIPPEDPGAGPSARKAHDR